MAFMIREATHQNIYSSIHRSNIFPNAAHFLAGRRLQPWRGVCRKQTGRCMATMATLLAIAPPCVAASSVTIGFLHRV
eukprot:6524183-Prymnesium_polylepis.1